MLAGQNSHNQDVRKESLWALCNHLTCGEPEDVREMFLMEQDESNVVDVLIDAISSLD